MTMCLHINIKWIWEDTIAAVCLDCDKKLDMMVMDENKENYHVWWV